MGVATGVPLMRNMLTFLFAALSGNTALQTLSLIDVPFLEMCESCDDDEAEDPGHAASAAQQSQCASTWNTSSQQAQVQDQENPQQEGNGIRLQCETRAAAAKRKRAEMESAAATNGASTSGTCECSISLSPRLITPSCRGPCS
jgi:hypothetical protein